MNKICRLVYGLIIITSVWIPKIYAASPDYSLRMSVDKTEIFKDTEMISIILEIQELNNVEDGPISIRLPQNKYMKFFFDSTEVSRDGLTMNNSDWTMHESENFYIFTYKNTMYPSSALAKIGIDVKFHSPHYSQGNFKFPVSLNSSVRDENLSNNTSENIFYYFNMSDKEAPSISLNGEKTITLNIGDPYTELGAVAIDHWNNENVMVTVTGTVNTSVEGTYTIVYTAYDIWGHKAVAERKILVNSSTPVDCDYYADPLGGSMSNDGSLSSPWAALKDVMNSTNNFNDNETLCLMSGNHGKVSINSYHFASGFTIKAKEGENPFLENLMLNSSDHMIFKDLTIDGSTRPPTGNISNKEYLVVTDVASHHLTFENITVKSADDSSTWTKNDWYAKVYNGARFRGEYISVLNSLFLNTYLSVQFDGDHALMSHTTIDNFAADAIRGLGSYSTYEYNTVRDCYIDDYAIQHDDAFQAYKLTGDLEITDVTIRFNTFNLFADPITPFIENNNLVGTLMQGLIITDGHANNWTVENNLIINAQSHGISLYGGRNSKVQNNTVIQHPHYYSSDTAKIPRIYIDKNKKSGQEADNFNNIIRNNIAAIFTTWTYASDSIFEGNTQLNRNDINSYINCFLEYNNQDFHLKSTSIAINSGIDQDLSLTDLDGNNRKVGIHVDAGSYEYQ